MPIELNDEEKVKFTEHLKELGYDDHAKKVIERVNNEAKTNREAREKLEAELVVFRDAEAKRKADDATRLSKEAEAAAAVKKKLDDEKKTLEQRISEIEENFAKKLTSAEKAQVKKQEEFLGELKARDAQILMQAVRASAAKRGIIDEELVSLIDVSKIAMERGNPDRDAIDAMIEEHAKAKPHLYRSEEDREKRAVRPDALKRPAAVDASKLNEADFDALTERLRSGRV